jgi:hypothetical protein
LQTWWGRIGSPQDLQDETFGAVIFQCARRWSRFCELVRFFGTPIVDSVRPFVPGMDREGGQIRS